MRFQLSAKAAERIKFGELGNTISIATATCQLHVWLL
jgi:hypothetical protein